MQWTHQIHVLQAYALFRVPAQNERQLLNRLCCGAAITASGLIGFCCAGLIYDYQFVTITIFSSGTLIPLSLLIARRLADRLIASWLTSKDLFARIRYLELEFEDDVSIIAKLTMPGKQKSEMIRRRYEQLATEKSEWRKQIKIVDDPSQPATNTNARSGRCE